MDNHSLNKEQELLQQIANGDERALEIIFTNYRGKIHNYLLHITKSREAAEEMLMDIFLKLWVGRDMLVEIYNLEGFLFKVAHNKALDFFKTTARQERLYKSYAEHFRLQEADQNPYIQLDETSLQLLNEAINQLTPRRKLIYTLSREQNMTYDQIAQHLQLSRKTVKNSMLTALNSIRQHLKNNNPNSLLLLFLS